MTGNRKLAGFAAAALACLLLAGASDAARGASDARDRTEIYLPVLKLHHVVSDGEETREGVITESKLRELLRTLAAHGYGTVTAEDIAAFAEGRDVLPEKPVLLTFDDGYRSFYTSVYPMLREFDAYAVAAVVGWSAGRTTYLDGVTPIIPHFSWDEAREMAESGRVGLASHTFDMHGPSLSPDAGGRHGAVPYEGESAEEYTAALARDLGRMKTLIGERAGESCMVFSYPYGAYDARSESVLDALGIPVSLTSDEGMNRIARGGSLRCLRRYGVEQTTDIEALVRGWDALMRA